MRSTVCSVPQWCTSIGCGHRIKVWMRKSTVFYHVNRKINIYKEHFYWLIFNSCDKGLVIDIVSMDTETIIQNCITPFPEKYSYVCLWVPYNISLNALICTSWWKTNIILKCFSQNHQKCDKHQHVSPHQTLKKKWQICLHIL